MNCGNYGKTSRLRESRRSKPGEGYASTNDEDILMDEDYFREIDLITKDATKPHRLCGTNLTQYSMYGKYCAD